MTRLALTTDVFTEAVARMESLYAEGHRIVVSYSGGKDSHVCMEICIIAAERTGRLPVEVLTRDEEIMFPGTFELCERTRERPEVDFHWVWASQPIVNVFDREAPYFWPFDEQVDPDLWVRKPPPYAYKIEDLNIKHMIVPDRFPPAPGKDLITVIGLRGAESNRRLMGVHNSGGFLTKSPVAGAYHARPLYDWQDGDVWLAHKRFGWDWNSAYDVMMRMGVPRHRLRIAPPTLSVNGATKLQLASKAWPQWFERVARRLPGVRTVAQFGTVAISPSRRFGETWEEAYQRECIDTAPAWIAERSAKVREVIVNRHSKHSSQPIPDVTPCRHCTGAIVSWKKMAKIMYLGDPLSVATDYLGLKDMEPEFFRPGSGVWYPKNRERKK